MWQRVSCSLHGLYGFGKAHPNLNKAPISFFKMKLNIKNKNYHKKIGRCLKFSTIIAQNFFSWCDSIQRKQWFIWWRKFAILLLKNQSQATLSKENFLKLFKNILTFEGRKLWNGQDFWWIWADFFGHI
jgi:hypothetical protein